MSALQSFVKNAWNTHGDNPRAAAQQLPEALPLLQSDDDVAALVGLAHHLFGVHLGQWSQGQAFLMALQHHAGGSGMLQPGGVAEAELQRAAASLALSKGQRDMRPALSTSDQVRVTAMAAANLAAHDTPRALALLDEALQHAQRAGLPDSDPMHRVLAVAGNNLAATLEEQASRSADERALMIKAAQVGRVHWEKAGTWLETERAEYRLASSWLKAGDADEARRHAQECLRIIDAQQGDALERFFGLEVLVLAERAAGHADAAAASLQAMQSAFRALKDDDKAWCRMSLDKLAG